MNRTRTYAHPLLLSMICVPLLATTTASAGNEADSADDTAAPAPRARAKRAKATTGPAPSRKREAKDTAKPKVKQLKVDAEKMKAFKPPAKARRASRGMTASVRQTRVSPKATAARWVKREQQATPQVKAKLKAVRAKIQKKKLSWVAGPTSVLDRDLVELTGETASPMRGKPKRGAASNLARRGTMRASSTIPVKSPVQDGLAESDGDGNAIAGAAFCSQNPYDSQCQLPRANPYQACDTRLNSFSWISHMTPVKNQESCGSCWAFAALGVMEDVHSIANQLDLDLSEQAAHDCRIDGRAVSYTHLTLPTTPYV